MDIVETLKGLMLHMGPAPITWLMIGLSVFSLVVIVERAWFYRSTSASLEDLLLTLGTKLRDDDLDGAKDLFSASRSTEAAVLVAGLLEARRGAKAAEDAMAGAVAIQRARLERRLSFLATLGSNAPFVGLLGTVIAIVVAFDKLGATAPPGEVMATIGEALVATAVGLALAIPAVAAFNVFQRRIKVVASNTEALSRMLLAHLRDDEGPRRETASATTNATVHAMPRATARGGE